MECISFTNYLIGEWSASIRSVSVPRHPVVPFSPLLIGEWSASEQLPKIRRTLLRFQSPPHRGMECIALWCLQAGNKDLFQSPPHRGMECICSAGGYLYLTKAFSPLLIGEWSASRHRRRRSSGEKHLSVPSSSGNGVHHG